MLRLTETWKYGYGDVLTIKDMTCTYKEDQELLDAVHDAEPFFNSLDSASISICDKASILKRYRYFLQVAKNTDFNSRNELLRFIRQEDFLFRSFLTHLYEMDNEPLSDITKNTEQICRNIFLAAKNGKISSKDVVVYMSMRTVRRLLQSSAECVENVNRALKRIGTMAGLKRPVTMYVARHSWASIARDMDISISVISEGMGHQSCKTTQIYLDTLDTSKINAANRRIIGEVNKT